MIRQNNRAFREHLASLGSKKAQDDLIRELNERQKVYEINHQKRASDLKRGLITASAKELEDLADAQKFETWAVANKFYENITPAQLESERIAGLVDQICELPPEKSKEILKAVSDRLR